MFKDFFFIQNLQVEEVLYELLHIPHRGLRACIECRAKLLRDLSLIVPVDQSPENKRGAGVQGEGITCRGVKEKPLVAQGQMGQSFRHVVGTSVL
jgi:hypothetical protein